MPSQRPYASPQRNLQDTAESVRLIWSLIGDLYDGGTIHSLEEREELHELDADAGIDFVQLLPGRQRRTWASRIQWGSAWYSSFSIRYSRPTGRATEYGKRIEAYRHGLLMPDRTMQGYLDARPPFGEPIAVGTIETRKLYEFMDSPEFGLNFDKWSHGRQYRPRGNRIEAQPLPWTGYRELRDGTRFIFVTWALLEHVGLPVRVHKFTPDQALMWDPVQVSL